MTTMKAIIPARANRSVVSNLLIHVCRVELDPKAKGYLETAGGSNVNRV